MRNIVFYKKLFGDQFTFNNVEHSKDIVRIIDVDNIVNYENKIINMGGDLTVPMMELSQNKRVAYYSDPEGYIFALLEDGQ